MSATASTPTQGAKRSIVPQLLIILCWVPYSVALSGRVFFMIREGGMEWRDGTGSPLLFVIGMAMEFTVLAVPALVLTIIIHSCSGRRKPNKAPEPTTTSVTPPAAQEPRQP